MKVQNSISPEIIGAAAGLLQKHVPGLTATNLIAALKDFEPSQAPEKPGPAVCLTMKEAAEALHVSFPTIWRMRRAGLLSTVKVGPRRILIPLEAVNKLLTSVPAVSQSQNPLEAAQ
jgi:excisionase family DNA binding protein